MDLTSNNNTIKFHEIQWFRQKWLQAIVVGVSLYLIISFCYGMIRQLVYGYPWGNRPMSDTALIIIGPLMILLGIGLPWFFYSMKLITEVREDGVYINFFPLSRQIILFENIESCKVRTYKPIREYGGWGIRYGLAGKAYNVSGNRGVQLRLENGKGLLIGSQKPEELASMILEGMGR